MGLSGNLVSEISIKTSVDVFHKMFREKPQQLSDMSPDKVQNCDVQEGEWGSVGSVIVWNYFHDGKERVAKEIIEAIDDEKKSVTLKVIEGDLMEKYKTLRLRMQVDAKGEDNLITWNIEFEKVSEDVEDPHTLMAFCLHVAKDFETHNAISPPIN